MNEQVSKPIQEKIIQQTKRYKRMLRNRIDGKLRTLKLDQIPKKHMELVYLTQVPVDNIWGQTVPEKVLGLGAALSEIAAELPFIQALNMAQDEHQYMLTYNPLRSGNVTIYLEYK